MLLFIQFHMQDPYSGAETDTDVSPIPDRDHVDEPGKSTKVY